MRDLLSLLCGLAIATAGCGGTKSGATGDDDGSAQVPDPIAGGGVGGGAIVDRAVIQVIDDVTRDPIAGAHVLIGNFAGTSDETGVVIATGLAAGAQQLTVTAPGYRAEMWLGVNGQNLTVDLHVGAPLVPPTKTLSGIVDIGTADLGHTRSAIVACSETDDIGDPANTIRQPTDTQGAPKSSCEIVIPDDPPLGTQPDCTFSVICRTGSTGLLARITDSSASVETISYAYVATPGTDDDANVHLSAIGKTVVQVDIGAPPDGEAPEGVVGIELSGGDLFQLRTEPVTSGDATVPTSVEVPALGDVGGTAMRLTAIASVTSSDTLTSVTLQRHLMTARFPAPMYLAPTLMVTAMTTGASWKSIAGATVQEVGYSDATGTGLLNVTSFDPAITSFTLPTIPDLTIPTGATTQFSGLVATGLHLTDFGLDADGDKVTAIGAHITVAH